jgi:hypothetical protein
MANLRRLYTFITTFLFLWDTSARLISSPQKSSQILRLLRLERNDNSTQSQASEFRALGPKDVIMQESSELKEGLMDPLKILERMSNKLSKTFHFRYDEYNRSSPNQVLHLHHMKTGGTSMEGLIRCATNRWGKVMSKKLFSKKVDIPVMSLHECGLSMYNRCLSKEDKMCFDLVNKAPVLNYCAPLMDLSTFGWKLLSGKDRSRNLRHLEDGKSAKSGIKQTPLHPYSITVLRHPVDRVWSMFRFQTKRCYECRNLTDVYESIANGSFDGDKLCRDQLLNHQTRNLVSTKGTMESNDTDQILRDAMHNLEYVFTLVGLTSNMPETTEMVGMVFPFMNETLPLEMTFGISTEACPMPHANASPENNRCGPNATHWDLPPHPDPETEAVILKYNTMDLKVYEFAVQLFEFQKLALGLGETEVKRA